MKDLFIGMGAGLFIAFMSVFFMIIIGGAMIAVIKVVSGA